MNEEKGRPGPIDCWDNCDCNYCKDCRNDWLNDEYNKRALKWLKENENR